ncbi:hypothetical protein HID58_093824, partial [Brassica napus]
MAISKLHERKLKSNDLKYRQSRISFFTHEDTIKLIGSHISVASDTYLLLFNFSITLNRLIRKGISPVLREKVCLSLSDAAKKSPPPRELLQPRRKGHIDNTADR